MADKLDGGGGIIAGGTSVSLTALLVSSTVFTETTGKVAADMTLSYCRQGGTVTTFAASDLAAVNSAYSSGGVKELSAANQPGMYRIDIPDAAAASGADWVLIAVKVSSVLVYYERFPLVTAGSAAVYARLGAPAGASIAADIAGVAAAAATAVWAAGTRTLTSFGTYVADTAFAVWASATRTLTAGGDATAANQTSILNRLGAPAGASMSADVAAVKSDTGTALTRLGSPAGASVSADVAAVKADTARTLGLSQDNSVLDNTSYDADGNLTSATLYVYDTAAHATTHDGATGLLYKWTLSGTITTGNLTLAKQLRVT